MFSGLLSVSASDSLSTKFQNTLAFIFLFSYFVDFMTAPKSISITLLFLFSVYNFTKTSIRTVILNMQEQYKKSIAYLLLFVCFIIILNFFSSVGYLSDSLKSLQKDAFYDKVNASFFMHVSVQNSHLLE